MKYLTDLDVLRQLIITGTQENLSICVVNIIKLFNSYYREDFDITHLANPITKDLNIHAYQAKMRKENGSFYHGLSVGKSSEKRKISMVELYERYKFCNSSHLNLSVDNNLGINFIKTNDLVNVSDKKQVIQDDKSTLYVPTLKINDYSYCAINKELILGGTKNRVTSSGCSIHSSVPAMIYTAMKELIERDILLRNWLFSLPPARIENLSSIGSKLINQFSKDLDDYFYSVEFYSYNDGIMPVSICTISNKKGEYPYLFVGTGCSISLKESLEHALTEALSGWVFNYSSFRREKIYFEYAREDQPKMYYLSEKGREVIDFFKSGTITEYCLKENSLQEKQEIIDNMLSSYDFYLLPLLNDLNNKTSPFGVKAFSSQLFPMYFGDFPFYIPKNFDVGRISNLLPHPY